MKEVKIRCDICKEIIANYDYENSFIIRGYLSGNLIPTKQVDICPDCKKKIKNGKMMSNDDFVLLIGNYFIDLINQLI